MKLTVLLLLMVCIQVSAHVDAQNITYSKNNVSLEKVFSEIRKQTGYEFLYNTTMLEKAKRSDLSFSHTPLKKALGKIFKDLPLTYTIIDKTIVVRKRTQQPLPTQPKNLLTEVQGTVIDSATGKPLVGVTIKVKSSTIGTTTDANGHFSLDVSDDAVLVVSYLGYTTKEVSVSVETNFNISLTASTTGLNQLVVVGYGMQKKRDLTGSIATVKPAEIQETPIMSIDQGLVGRASGVMVTQTSGMPGAIASIHIRGANSLLGGNEPLYVIDGIPVYSGSGYGQTGGKTRISPLATINPSDIESIAILKDASATAIYGSRAANGVILITTKSGKRGKDIISFNAYYGTQTVVKELNLMDGENYARLLNQAYINDGLTPPLSEDFISNIPNNGKGTDWQDEIFRRAPIQNYDLSFSGGDERTTYLASVNYMDQKGIIIGSNMKRYSGRLNLTRKMLDNKFKLSSHLSLSRILSNNVSTEVGGNGSAGGVVTEALTFNPAYSVYKDKESKIYTPVNGPGGIPAANPVATALEVKNLNTTTRLLADISGEYEITKELKAKVLFGLDYFINKGEHYTPSFVYQSNGIGQGSIGDVMRTNWMNANTLSYSKTFNQVHKIDFVGGITFQRERSKGVTASAQDFVNDVLEDNNLGTGSVYNRPASSFTEWSIISLLGRINYNYKSKYLLTLSGRYDGSSRFGENHKFAFFPSAAVAWRAGQEKFIENLNLFSHLKIRLGVGETGNQEFGLYQSLPTLGSSIYTIGSNIVTGFFPNKIPNPNLKWEKNTEYDIGMDLGFLDGNISLTMDYYYRKGTDLIFNVAVPLVSGFGSALQNIAKMQNKGFELSLNTNNLNKGFKWRTSFNISFNKSKVLYLGGEQFQNVGSGDGHLKTGQVHRLIVGKPLDVFYGYVFDGIFQNKHEVDQGPVGTTNYVGGKRYKDISGPEGHPDGKVGATYDRTIIGDPNPKFYGGITNTFNYKGFGLRVFMNYSYGNDIFNYNSIQLGLPSGGQNVYADLVPWSPEHPGNKYGKATTNRSAIFSNQFIEDGSFIKLKTVTLFYRFSELKSNILNNLKIYVTAQNLLTVTGYSGYDPEVSYRGVTTLQMGEDFGGYPQARSFLFGLSFNLK